MNGVSSLAIMVTAAQSGKTETMLDIIGERLDNRPVPILYVGPSKEFNTDQFEPRLRDLFTQAASLGAKVVGGLDGKRQKKTLKRVAGVTLRLGTAGSPTSLKSSPAGMALVDEYDDMLKNLRDQGDVLGLIMARGETYADFVAGVTSTPSQGLVEPVLDPVSGLIFWAIAEDSAVTSPIWRLWQRGARYHWCWPCPHCRAYFVPRRDRLRYSVGATPAEAKRNSWLECPRCEGEIHEHYKAELNARGAYVAPGQSIAPDGTVTGAPAETYTSRWVSGLCSPFKTFGDRAERYLAALATKEPAKIQTAINAAFGEVAVQSSGDAPDHDAIAAKAVGYSAGIVPREVVTLVAGIDVQKSCLYYVIRGFGARGTSWLIRHGILGGYTAGTAVWNDLGTLLTTPIDGMLIKIAIVDSGFRPGEKAFLPINRIYEFCRLYRRFVYPSKGSSVPMVRPMIESAIDVLPEDGTSKKYGLRLLRLDSGHWKSAVHERLGLTADVPGCMHLNADADEDYRRQLVAETRVRGPTGRAIWVPLQGANHYLDCEAMAAAAAFRLNADSFGPKAAERVAARRQEKTPDPSGTAPIVAPPAASRVTPIARGAVGRTPAGRSSTGRSLLAGRAVSTNRVRMGLFSRMFGAALPPSPPAAPRPSAEYMRGGRSGVFDSWLPWLRDSRDDVRRAYYLSAARTIELMHNSGWLAGLILQAKASIIGDGLQLVPKPDFKALGWTQAEADAWSATVKREWNAWADNALECDAAGKFNLHQQVRSGISSFFGAGEIVQLMRWINRPQSKTRTKIQLIPAHRLVQESNGVDLFQGIRIDPNGMPTGYRMRLPTPLLETGMITEFPARDNANRPIVAHVFDGEIGQMRGISPFAPVLRRMREFDHLTGGTLATELIRSLIAATITSEKPTVEVLQAFQDPEEQGVGSTMDGLMEARDDWYGNTSFDLGGLAKLVHLFPGEKLDLQTGSKSASVYEPLANMLLRETAICSGHTVEEMTGDYSGSSYSSIRIATTTRWPITQHRRRHIAAPLYQVAYACWLEEQIDAGLVPFPGGLDTFLTNRDSACRAVWRGPPKPQADDLKFAKSTETLARMGVLTDERICGELGEDWEDVYRQRAEEMALRKQLGLPEVIYSGATILNEDDLEDEPKTGNTDKTKTDKTETDK